MVLDEEDGSEDEPTETIRLRPYYDWRVSESVKICKHNPSGGL